MARLRTTWRALLAALTLSGCAAYPPHPEAFSFGIFGDAPYNERELHRFLELIEYINVEPLAFVLHVGDMKAGTNAPCTDALYLERRQQFERLKAPFHFVPGDNDWVDCRRPTNGRMDPIESLGRLRSVFYADGPLASPKAIAGERQPAYPENIRWSRSRVVFVTLNVQGSNDNVGFNAANDAGRAARLQANLAWLAAAVREAGQPGARGMVVIFHANPFGASGGSKPQVYQPVLAALRDAARALGKPVALIHGDTHHQRVDRPFTDADGKPIANLVRMETFGSPWVGWVKVTVDPGDPELFSFEPRLP
ncbi:hypothetical protein BWI17_20640 [Betaproteobacteria bacterium GR16-43]|nr:hypothetical protein BWI17_20640 [Betaproteobacteria bacterium GR16-43]